MFIVRFCTIHLVVFSGFLTYTYAMVDRSDKHPQVSSRQERQLGPVLNSIVFLIAANLVAKGALGLGAYQAPPIPGNIQGSLVLSLNAPNSFQQAQAQQYQQFPQLTQFPLGQQPKPVSQTQVINIGEPLYEEVEEYKDKGFERAFGSRYNTLEDPLEAAASNEVEVTTPTTEIPSTITTTTPSPTTTEISTTPEDVEILSENANEDQKEEVEPVDVARQNNDNNATTMRPTSTEATNTTTATMPVTMSSPQTTNVTATQPSVVYGPPLGFGFPQVSFAYGPPLNITNGTNVNQTIINATHPGYNYNYFPAGDYGPYTGNEQVSITYGPPLEGPNYQPLYQRPEFLRPEYQTPNLRPIYQRPAYQKPFLSSPEDPFLNRYNEFQNNYDGFYNNPSSYMNTFKYSDFYKSFYNNYPSVYNNNNYLGKK